LVGPRFAIYARKSTEDARHEDHRSTARQVEHARGYVARAGGEVPDGHVYMDESVSGAEFKNRAAPVRLLDTIKNGRPSHAVVMSEESRLGREQVETAYVVKQITDAGVRVFYCLEDREARLDSALDKIMASPTLFGAELEREKARQRCREAAERKAREG
jgi:DNA invertase Pin-like site-specific DNA recombinase